MIEREGKKQIYIAEGSTLKSGDKTVAKLRPVEIGETNWSFTQVTSGLKAGDSAITTPEASGLKDGITIQIE